MFYLTKLCLDKVESLIVIYLQVLFCYLRISQIFIQISHLFSYSLTKVIELS